MVFDINASFGINSNIVSLYVELSLGLKITQTGSATEKVKELYDLAWALMRKFILRL